MARVNVIYHHYPHYRRPVMEALTCSGAHDYRFWGSLDDVAGIKTFRGDARIPVRPLRFRLSGPFWLLGGYWPAVLDRSADALIVHGHPNMPASWLIGLAGRLTGKPVLYWAHGWLKRESRWKAFLRRLHYRLGQRVLTYGLRAHQLASASGFPVERIVPVWNSLDWPAARDVLHRLETEGVAAVRRRLGLPPAAFVVQCSARLMPACRFDLLLEAAGLLKGRGVETHVVLIGEGPQRAALEAQAEELGVKILFPGAIYEETVLGAWIFSSDVTASPGKIGLSAIHSLMYGTPVVTHGDMDRQMPETEAIIPGETGSFFPPGDAAALAEALLAWRDKKSAALRARCREAIETRYNPQAQATIIDAVVSEVCHAR